MPLQKALDEYLDNYETLLEYSLDNYESIIFEKQPQSLKYDELYLKYMESNDNRWKAYLDHKMFLLKYSEGHPEIIQVIDQAEQMLQ